MAGIHRTTFYGHFTDVYDCMEKLVQEMYQKMMAHFLKEEWISLTEGFLWLFAYIREHRSLFLSFLESRNEIATLQGIPELLQEQMGQLTVELGMASEEELMYHQEFFSAGLLAMIRRWLLRGCPESPEEMLRILGDEYRLDRGRLLGEAKRKVALR